MKPKVLVILENWYGNMPGRLKRYTYGTAVCNHRNLTFSRIFPYLEDEFEVRIGETTPQIGTHSKQKFPVDQDWMRGMVESEDWFAVIVMSSRAKDAMNGMKLHYDLAMNHPAAWGWKKETIMNCREFLLKRKGKL